MTGREDCGRVKGKGRWKLRVKEGCGREKQ